MITDFIHGNLQTSRVWEPFRSPLPGVLNFVELGAYPADNCMDWASAFCDAIPCISEKQRYLVGYSLGGRLALHALLHKPHIWAGAVIISAHPGSASSTQRQRWYQNDCHWADRFRNEPWPSLMKTWDSLPVFGGRPNPCPPYEADFERETIAQTFIAFSKGQQPHLTPLLKQTDLPPIYYLSGEQDPPYDSLGRQLAQECPTIEQQRIPKAGHRLPWENPKDFVIALKKLFQVF